VARDPTGAVASFTGLNERSTLALVQQWGQAVNQATYA